MKHLMTRKRTLILVLGLVLIMAFSAIATAGLATSPLGLNSLAGLGSCPSGTILLSR